MGRTDFKKTIWIELKFTDCEIIDIDPEYWSIKVKHPALKRPRWFALSQRGNWYSRYTLSASDVYAEGYIIKNGVDYLDYLRRLKEEK